MATREASKLKSFNTANRIKLFFNRSGKVCLCLLFFKFVSIDSKMNIKAYLKPHCGWSMGVRAIMEKYTLEYEDLDIINNQNLYAEMVEKSGQPFLPVSKSMA